ncbi:741_t:CDS:2 [Ambispora gerdemannii]|uniref:741_t:CDS:1 n=1 Tax=Ambispora gerdemannii TaxID=144530 RepID=A0A9N8V3M6_9GLOM|nr:741_t:CDS:2 [Ambispora gerdemannii]
MKIPSARLQKRLVGLCIICEAKEFEDKFQRFTKDTYRKVLQHEILNSTWILNVIQFCNSHYMSYIVNDINTEKKGKVIGDQIDCDDSQQELKMKSSEMNDDGRINEINFIECISDQAIDTLSNMQLSSTSRKNRRGKNIISSIYRDNVARELVKYQKNVVITNIDDYHNIHDLRIPTTTSTSMIAYMITVLAILISTAKNQFMALLSQSFNDQFARKPAYAENLLDNLMLNLHLTEIYIKAMETFASFPEFHEYLQHNVIPLVTD